MAITDETSGDQLAVNTDGMIETQRWCRAAAYLTQRLRNPEARLPTVRTAATPG